MAAVTNNFVLEQGSDFSISFQYNDENGNGLDLSDSCVLLRWKQNDNNEKAFSSQSNSSLSNGGYTLSSTNSGRIELLISSEKTKEYIFDSAIYDLDVIQTVNSIKKNIRLSTGQIAVIKRNFAVETDCSKFSANPDVAVTSSSTNLTPTPTPTVTESADLCLPEDCIELDLYSVVYTGSGVSFTDYQDSTSDISVSNTGLITNVEVAVNGLRTSYPQDLTLILQPPSGNKILLSSSNKITNYSNPFSFMFSNKAASGSYLNNITNGGLCNITDKTSYVKYNADTLSVNLTGLVNTRTTGVWSLRAIDRDAIGSGSIDSWKLILTYEPTYE